MKAPLMLLLTLSFLTPVSAFADCIDTACVDVFTLDNQIIIEAHKGTTTTVVKKRATPRPTSTLWFPPKPRPVPTVKRTYKPRVVVKKPVVKTANLSDRLIKMIPTAGVAFSPEVEPLSNVPVIFWCDVPQMFQSRVSIIGEVVDVALRPGFIWSFGDGSMYSTGSPGAPYPKATIKHTYKQPGVYAVILVTTWNGSFTHNGALRPISGQVIKTSVATVTVVSARTRFTK
ncbi:MAG: PKD domain-containing protein [Streptomycetaceae bacterium]|nr:MAG: PKD domain-containing protein [Streptomycetaceae bacterium]